MISFDPLLLIDFYYVYTMSHLFLQVTLVMETHTVRKWKNIGSLNLLSYFKLPSMDTCMMRVKISERVICVNLILAPLSLHVETQIIWESILDVTGLVRSKSTGIHQCLPVLSLSLWICMEKVRCSLHLTHSRSCDLLGQLGLLQ